MFLFEVVQSSVKVQNITQNKESYREGGYIWGGGVLLDVFLGLQIDGPITRGRGGGGYKWDGLQAAVCSIPLIQKQISPLF